MIVYDWVLALGTLAVVLNLYMIVCGIRLIVRAKRHTILHRWRQ